jgi:hypothetical protein
MPVGVRGLLETHELTSAEELLCNGAAEGQLVDLTTALEENDPAEGGTWGPQRQIRSQVIYQLLTGDEPQLAGTVVAVRLSGARILGDLRLAGSKLRCPLELRDCHVDANIELAMAEAPAISLAGSHLSGRFLGRQLTVTHTLDLSAGFRCDSGVELDDARIGGTLDCSESQFAGTADTVLSAEGIGVGVDMLVTGARCSGSVALNAADIGGTLDFTEAELDGSDSVALSAENLSVGKNMYTRRVRSSGRFHLFGARVSGQLTCTGGVFSNRGGEAFNGEQLVVGSYMLLRRVECAGQVRLFGARVGALLDCEGAKFEHQDDVAVFGDQLVVDADLGFQKVSCSGQVSLDSARIGGTLNCSESRLAFAAGAALSAESINVGVDMLLTGARCSGSVALNAADIGGTLDFTEAELGGSGIGRRRVALSAENLTVGKNMYTRRVRSSGQFFLFGARVSGQLTCTGGVFSNPGGEAFNGEQLVVGSYMLLRRVECAGQVRLFGARVGALLDCEGAKFENQDDVAVFADRLVVDADLGFRNVRCSGQVSLDSARIGGTLNCSESRLAFAAGAALSAEGIGMGVDMLAIGVRCSGSVVLNAADIGGTLDFTEAELGGSGIGRRRVALSAENLTVGKNMYTRKVRSSGQFFLFGARLSGQLTCTGGVFSNPGGEAFNGEQLVVGSYMFLRWVECVGQVRLFGARVGAQLDCEHAKFENPDGVAVFADRLVVDADLGFRNVSCSGQVSLDSARIGGTLDCSAPRSERSGENPDPTGSDDFRITALSADRIVTTGAIRLVDLVTEEGVLLADARIGGELECAGADLRSKSGPALNAERATVSGPVYLNRGFTAVGGGAGGAVRFLAAELRNQLNCQGAVLRNATGPALAADRLQVGGDIRLDDGFTAEGDGTRATIRLTGASIHGHLYYDDASVTNHTGPTHEWHIDGLTYSGAPRSGAPEKQRDAWLDVLRNHTPEYAAQPYQHLAAVFRSQGHDGDVRAILMRQRRDQIERGALTHRIDRFWARLTGTLLGYGYQPWRALLCLVGLLAVSVILTASLAAQNALTHPVQQQQAPAARLTASGPPPSCSTIEVISVGLDLGTPFLPDTSTASSSCQIAGNSMGAALAISRWVLQLGAWALAALFVAGFTGIVRKT